MTFTDDIVKVVRRKTGCMLANERNGGQMMKMQGGEVVMEDGFEYLRSTIC